MISLSIIDPNLYNYKRIIKIYKQQPYANNKQRTTDPLAQVTQVGDQE